MTGIVQPHLQDIGHWGESGDGHHAGPELLGRHRHGGGDVVHVDVFQCQLGVDDLYQAVDEFLVLLADGCDLGLVDGLGEAFSQPHALVNEVLGRQFELKGIEGLDENGIGTHLDARQAFLFTGVRGHRDDRDVAQGVIGSHPLDKVLATHDGHPQARDDQGRYEFQSIVQCLAAIMGKAQFVILFQVVGNKVGHLLIVLDNEHEGTLVMSSFPGAVDSLLGKADGGGGFGLPLAVTCLNRQVDDERGAMPFLAVNGNRSLQGENKLVDKG